MAGRTFVVGPPVLTPARCLPRLGRAGLVVERDAFVVPHFRIAHVKTLMPRAGFATAAVAFRDHRMVTANPSSGIVEGRSAVTVARTTKGACA